MTGREAADDVDKIINYDPDLNDSYVRMCLKRMLLSIISQYDLKDQDVGIKFLSGLNDLTDKLIDYRERLANQWEIQLPEIKDGC